MTKSNDIVERDDIFASPSSPTSLQTEKIDPEAYKKKVTCTEDEAPNGGYGWVCVGCTFFINAHTWGINSSFGVFLAYFLANNHYPRATPIEYAFIGGLSVSQALLISPVATIISRRYGTKYTLSAGIVLQTTALISASFTHQVWQLFLSQGICFGYGMGLLFVGSVGIIPQWFTTKRSFANGIGTAGSGLGGMMYSLATSAMIRTLGLQWAFRILGILTCTVNLICTILFKDRNKAVGATQKAFDYRLLRRSEFCLLLGWGFFSLMGYIVLLFSLPDYAVTIGLTQRQGSIVGALLNLGQGLGRPIVGIISDGAGRINISAAATFLAGLFSLVIWIFAKTYGVLIFFAILVGTVAGTFWTTVGPVCAEVVGIKELPSALSLVWIFLVIPTTFSEPTALALREKTGNIYLHAQIFTGFMYICAGLCMWGVRAWKIGQMQGLVLEQARNPDMSKAAERDDVDMVELGRTVSRASRKEVPSFRRRLFMLRRV